MYSELYEKSGSDIIRELGKRYSDYRKRMGYTQKEVAEKMGISVDTLYSTLYRAKQWIKKYYEEQFHQLDGK